MFSDNCLPMASDNAIHWLCKCNWRVLWHVFQLHIYSFITNDTIMHCILLTTRKFIYVKIVLGVQHFVVFNSQDHIVMSSLQVEETSAYCTVNHQDSNRQREL